MKNTILLLFALLLFCSNGMAQVSASTPPRHGSWVKIKVQQTGKYLSVANGSKENGARIVQWDDVNQKNQKFQNSRIILPPEDSGNLLFKNNEKYAEKFSRKNWC